MAIVRVLLSPSDLSVSGATAADGAPVTSDAFSTADFNKLTATVALTWAAATRIDVALQYSQDGGTTWYTAQRESVSSGVVTHAAEEHQIATGGASGDITIVADINYLQMRLVIEGVGGTTDVVSATVLLGLS